MSSDSDLDFESADEDTNYDIHTKNNNTSQKRRLMELNNKDSLVTKASPENESCVTDSRLEETVNMENSQSLATPETCSNVLSETVSESTPVKHSTEKTDVVAFSGDLVETLDIKDDDKKETNEVEIEQSNLENDTCKVQQEKQRVPLRLEKKIRQKSLASKENSVEKEDVSTENSQKQTEVKSLSWGFGSWGTNLLSTAASSVSTFTTQVSQGIGTVLETVENSLGAPAPEDLAVTLSKAKDSPDSSVHNKPEGESSGLESNEVNRSEPVASILPDVSSWTKVLENTGSKVVMGGLNTLELIGKKTIDIITEGDPGLRKKRSAFADGITLSQLLREAKTEADEAKQDSDSQGMETIHYSQLFDEYQGLVHLEALEMLSKQSQAKIQRLLMRIARNVEARKHMEEIKSICENIPPLDDPTECENFEEFDTVCKKYVLELSLPFNVENLIRAQKRIIGVVKNYESTPTSNSTPEEIYQSAICSLAEFTAKSMETFHKMAELMLVQPTLEPSVEHFATNLTGLTTVMCIEVNNLSLRYHNCLDAIAEQSEDNNSLKSHVTTIVTNLYVEASNSNKYIQDAFLLLVPVLQVSELESAQ